MSEGAGCCPGRGGALWKQDHDAQGLLGKETMSPKRLEEPGRCTLEWRKSPEQGLVFKQSTLGQGVGARQLSGRPAGGVTPGQVLRPAEVGLQSLVEKTVLHQHKLYFPRWLP